MKPPRMILSIPLLLIAAPASAIQDSGSLIFYSQPGFSGDRIVINGPKSTLSLPWNARSVQVADGDRWESCAGAQYRQPCFSLNADQAEIRRPMRVVRSLRLMRPAVAASPTRSDD